MIVHVLHSLLTLIFDHSRATASAWEARGDLQVELCLCVLRAAVTDGYLNVDLSFGCLFS